MTIQPHQTMCVHWALKETYHSFKLNHIWTLISYSTSYWAQLKIQRVAFDKKNKNAVTSQMVIFQTHRNCSQQRTSTKGRLFRTFNAIFEKLPLAILLHFTAFLLKQSSKGLFFEMCLVRSIIANLCLIMSHFNMLWILVSVALKKWVLLTLIVDASSWHYWFPYLCSVYELG